MESIKDSTQIPLLDQPVEKPKPLYFDNNIIDNYMFFWVNKFVAMANRKTFSQEDHWDLRKEESSEGITHNLNSAFESNKHKKNPLIKAIYTTNKVIFFKIIILSLIRSCFDYTGPFLINRIIDYTSDPNRKFSTGVFIVLGLVVARVMWSIIAARLRTFFVKKFILSRVY